MFLSFLDLGTSCRHSPSSTADDELELSGARTERDTDDYDPELLALDMALEADGKFGMSLFSMLDSDSLSHVASLLSSTEVFALAEVCKELGFLFKPPALAFSSVSLRQTPLSQALQARSATSSQVLFQPSVTF